MKSYKYLRPYIFVTNITNIYFLTYSTTHTSCIYDTDNIRQSDVDSVDVYKHTLWMKCNNSILNKCAPPPWLYINRFSGCNKDSQGFSSCIYCVFGTLNDVKSHGPMPAVTPFEPTFYNACCSIILSVILRFLSISFLSLIANNSAMIMVMFWRQTGHKVWTKHYLIKWRIYVAPSVNVLQEPNYADLIRAHKRGSIHLCINTLELREIAVILQTAFSNAFSWMKIYEFRLNCH